MAGNGGVVTRRAAAEGVAVCAPEALGTWAATCAARTTVTASSAPTIRASVRIRMAKSTTSRRRRLDRHQHACGAVGHLGGDAVLNAVGTRMRAILRGSDLECWYGREEFLVPLPGAGGESSSDGHAGLGVTQALPGEMGAQELITRADSASYPAKEEGRYCLPPNYRHRSREISQHQMTKLMW